MTLGTPTASGDHWVSSPTVTAVSRELGRRVTFVAV